MDKSELSAADPGRRRVAAIVALVVGAATIVLAVVLAVTEFPRGLGLLACVVVAGAAAWFGALRRGTERVVGLAVAGLALVAAVVVVVTGGSLVASVLVIAGLLLSLAAARATLAVHVALAAGAERRSNRCSSTTRARVAEKPSGSRVAKEARARGIEPIELKPGDDLETLVRGAVDRGADALAMAGGDGSQAIVAAMAAERGLPYACIPAGTRNHFALDLGVDRDDVVGALDAFVDGGERTVDLAEVNGRVFVNNVSLGLYAEAVQHEGYRDAKLRTLLDTVPDVLGPEGEGLDLRWTGPDGHARRSGAVILVSNNAYRLGKVVGSGTRPRLDDGVLGVSVIGASAGRSADEDAGAGSGQPRWREWTAPTFAVDSDEPVPAGIDGEALKLDPPLRFRIRPGVLRVRIAPAHPGASPSALAPDGAWAGVVGLTRIAGGRDQELKPRDREGPRRDGATA